MNEKQFIVHLDVTKMSQELNTALSNIQIKYFLILVDKKSENILKMPKFKKI